MTDVEDFLSHHGVKGMKWGIRKEYKKIESLLKARKIKKSPVGSSLDARARDRILNQKNTKGLHSLSNRQLIDFQTRMNLEQSYSRLEPKNSVAKGHQFVKGGLAGAGTLLAVGVTANSAMQFAKSPAGLKLASMLGKKAATAL